MADNLAVKNEATTTVATIATDKVTYSGDADVDLGLCRIVGITGAEGSKTVVEIVGQQVMAQSFSFVPASDITDATYIGDIKFGEALPAGSAIIGNVRIDQTTPGTTNGVVEASAAAILVDTTSIDGKITACDTGAVVIASGTISLPTDAATETTLSSLNAKIISTLDTGTVVASTNSTVIAKIHAWDGIGSYGRVMLGAGLEATAVRVTLPTDGTGVVKLGAGTAEIGKLAAGSAVIGAVTQSGTWNIGTATTVTTVSTVTNLAQMGGVAISLNTGVRDTGTQRVTIATDDVVPVTGTFFQATQPVSLASVPTHAVTVASAGIASGAVASGAFASGALASGSVASGAFASGSIASGAIVDLPSLATGTNTIGKVNVPAVATGGATPGMLIALGTTNATTIKASAGTLYSLCVFNTNAAARYFKLYNKASNPTVGTDTPVQVFTIPGNTAGAGFVCPIPVCGIAFSTGIAFATTTGALTSDTGAVTASEIVISYSYL